MRRTRLLGRGFQAIAIAVVVLLLGAGIAFADPATGQSIGIEGTDAADLYTTSTSVSVDVAALHCPPGGDMSALEVAFRNSASDAWTVVKGAGDVWPGSDTDGCNAGVSTPASFSWTLASGADGSRTVFARFRHASDEVFAQDSITLDTTEPNIDYDGLTATSPSANAAGWYQAAVTSKFSASDGGSGLADCTSPWEVSSGASEGSNVLIPSGPCSDNAGNTNNGINAGPFKIDLTNPSVSITSPANNSSTSDSSVTVSGTASDSPSGLKSVTVNGSAVTVSNGQFSTSVALSCGANQITAVATDNADRTAQDQISVTRNCNSYALRYLSPIDGSTVGNIITNVGKNGRVIPVKVEVSLNGTELSEADLAAGDLTIGVNKMATCAASASDAVEAYADAGSSSAGTNAFRWSADAPGFWIYNLDTKALGMVNNTCYRLDVYLNGNKISESQFGVFKPTK